MNKKNSITKTKTRTPQKETEKSRLEHVLQLAELGWRVHPLLAGGKKPIVSGWPLEATTDETIITRWYNVDPKRNWGIACGSGLLVIDIDVKSGDGEKSWKELVGGKKLPKTVEAITPTNGRHLFFSYPSDKTIGNSVGAIAKYVDVRADGGYVAAAPSVTDQGAYEWIAGRSPHEIDVAPAPEWLIEDILKATPEQSYTPPGAPLENGNRNNSIYNYALKLSKAGTPKELVLIAVKRWLEMYNVTDMSDSEIISTVESAHKKAKVSTKFHLTDTGNAGRLISKYGDEIRYVKKWKKWLVWNGRFWEKDEKNIIKSLATDVVMDIYHEASSGKTKEERAKISHHAEKSESAFAIEAMVKTTSWNSKIAAVPDDFEKCTHLLNVANGTFNLETGELQEHNIADNFTRSLSIEYDPSQTCEKFLNWLSFATRDDKNLMQYLQRLMGRSLFGGNPERDVPYVYGPTTTGKTVLINTFAMVAGSYASYFNIELILKQRVTRNANDAEPALAKLVGARVAIGSEIPKNRQLNNEALKTFSGGDSLSTRELYGESFDFTPQFTPWLWGNYRLKVGRDDEAVFARLRMIPFTVQIEKSKVIPNLHLTFKDELPGILAWMIAGAREAHSLKVVPIPHAVEEELNAYKASEDHFQMWVDDGNLEPNPSAKASVPEIRDRFSEWYKRETGFYFQMPSKEFVQQLERVTDTETTRIRSVRYLPGWQVAAPSMVRDDEITRL